MSYANQLMDLFLHLQSFFQEHLKKHDQQKAILMQNLSAQTNILRALTETNAKYASVRKYIIDVKAK